MAEYNKTCLMCKSSFVANRKDKKFCKRWCYRNYPANKIKYRTRTDANRDKLKYGYKWRLQRLESKCRTKNYEIDIDLEHYTSLLNKGCHYCNASLNKETGAGLDRINNNKGYTMNNIIPCCGKCNQIRNIHLTKEEMEVAMKAILQHRNATAVLEEELTDG